MLGELELTPHSTFRAQTETHMNARVLNTRTHGGAPQPSWQGWASHSALQDGRDYPGASRQSQNVNLQPSFLLYWIFRANAPLPQFPFCSSSFTFHYLVVHLKALTFHLCCWLLLLFLKPLDPCFVLRSGEDSFTVSAPQVQCSPSAPHWSSHHHETKHQSGCHNHDYSAGGSSIKAQAPRQQ